MPVSEKQRRYLWSSSPDPSLVFPARAAAPSFKQDDFLALRERGLVGISDRVLREHLALYGAYCDELALLERARSRPALAAPPGLPSAAVQDVLGRRVGDLPLEISDRLADVLAQLKGELVAKGISWFPTFYLGEADFWTADQATSINVPWYLGDDIVWSLVNDQDTRYTPAEVLAILRHETAHAIGYAFEIWRRDLWTKTFGNFFDAYQDEFTIDPTSTDYVRHLHGMDASANAHYAQKHPDEDWAETFAVWLDPGSRWRETYAAWPGALKKLEVVDLLMTHQGVAYGNPVNSRVGRQVSFRTLDYTVGEYLGQVVTDAPDPHEAAIRRAPEVYSAVVLHESYFGGLARGAGGAAPSVLGRFGAMAGPDWAADLRAVAHAAGAGWALTVWDRRAAAIRNVLVAGHAQGVPPDCDLLLALDMFEHAFAGDVGTRRDVYVAAWFRNIDWLVVDARLARAVPPPVVLVTAPVAVAAVP